MSRRWRIVLPLLAGAAVFGIGVFLDGADLSLKQWLSYFGLGLLLPAVLLSAAAWLLVKVVLRPRPRPPAVNVSAPNGIPYGQRPLIADPLPDDPVEPPPRLIFGLAAVAFCAIAALIAFDQHSFLYRPPGHVGERLRCVFAPTVWLLPAALSAGLTWLALFAWRRRRSVGGRVLLGLSAVFVVACPFLFGNWRAWREHCRYEWLATQGTTRAASRMIDLRPIDWRGYANRVDAQGWGMRFKDSTDADEQHAIDDDIQTAIRLGCDDPDTRFRFAEVYGQMCYYGAARHRDELREYRAGFDLLGGPEPRSEAREIALTGMINALIDVGEFDEAADLCERQLGVPRKFLNANLALHLLAKAEIGRGRYRQALSILTERLPSSDDTRDPVLGWLLATCPEDGIRNADKAHAVLTAAIARPRSNRDSSTSAVYARWCLEGLAAAHAERGEYDQARAVLDRWKSETDWRPDKDPTGFWMSRMNRLDECIRRQTPFREQPVR